MTKQITEQQIEILVERLIRRIEQANIYYLEKIGNSVKRLKNLTPSQAQKIIQILKYGGNYGDIVKKIAKYTDLNVKDIDDIFSQYAKKDRDFYRDLYKYRNIPFDESLPLRTYRNALTQLVKTEMYDFTRSNVIGYTINKQFYNLRDTYNKLLDDALLNVGQGKETFNSAMRSILKDIGGSGLKTINYQSGRAVRLDSAIRTHLKARLREMHNENQKIIGQEIDSDGVEISVHENPAPDHELVQGRQFSNVEYNKLNSGLDAKSYSGIVYTLDHDHKNGYRPISEMNCYHYIFSIILGVSKPTYSDEQLKNIIDRNNKGFDFEGKHYTMYEGTQLQRMIERKIREQKDIQILARQSNDEILAGEAQNKITILTRKYKQLNDTSGLLPKAKRMQVATYRRSASATRSYKNEINKMKVGMFNISKYTDQIKPTTSDVILTPRSDNHIRQKHPEVVQYYNKLPDIMNDPDCVYMQLGKRKNTVWLTKQIDNKNIKLTMKINVSTLYQTKEIGYKNSILQMQILPKNRIQKKIEKGEIEKLFDIHENK